MISWTDYPETPQLVAKNMKHSCMIQTNGNQPNKREDKRNGESYRRAEVKPWCETEGMTACDTQVIGSTPQSDGTSILESATICRSYE